MRSALLPAWGSFHNKAECSFQMIVILGAIWSFPPEGAGLISHVFKEKKGFEALIEYPETTWGTP